MSDEGKKKGKGPQNEESEKEKLEQRMEGETSPPLSTEVLDEQDLEGDSEAPVSLEEDHTNDEDQKTSRPSFSGEAMNHNPEKRMRPIMTDTEYLQERLENQMNWYDRKSSINQRKYKKIRRREFVIATSVPVLITLSQMGVFTTIQWTIPGFDTSVGFNTLLTLVATVGGVYSAVLKHDQELEEYFKFWKEYRTMAEALQQERMRYVTRTEPYDEDDAYPLLVDKIESILGKENQKWRSRPEPAGKQQPNAQPGAAMPSQSGALPGQGGIPNPGIRPQ